MKEKINNYLDSLRKDKKKGFIAFALVVGLIATVGIGFATAGGDSEEQQEGTQISSLDVPVDTLSINNKTSNSSNAGSGDFFGGSDNNQEEISTEENDGPLLVDSPKKTYGYSPRSYQASNSYQKPKTSENVPVVVEPSTTKEKRKRVPSDGAGNLAVSSKMARGSIANDDKIVKSGSYVKIRLAEEMVVDGMKIPKNTVITGLAKPSGERMVIKVTSVKVGSTTKAVEWTVFDEDGNEGVAIPASVLNDISRDASGEVVEKGGSSVETNVPIVGSVKVNLKKKTQEVSFVLRNGHRVYIKEVK